MSAAEASSDRTQFFLRKLHSISGIVPIGFFLLEHFWTNSAALVSPERFNQAAGDLESAPWLIFAEIFGIWLPILYHGGYGIYIWVKGKNNVSEYPWVGNWMYTMQRYTGLIAFVFIFWHVYTERFLPRGNSTFAAVQIQLSHPLYFWFYVIGVTAATVRAQRAAGYLGVVVAITFTVVGLAIAVSFRYGWHPFQFYRPS
jgi:succinate dehydrogenase / fumarate reductase cytochrome b subunit